MLDICIVEHFANKLLAFKVRILGMERHEKGGGFRKRKREAVKRKEEGGVPPATSLTGLNYAEIQTSPLHNDNKFEKELYKFRIINLESHCKKNGLLCFQ